MLDQGFGNIWYILHGTAETSFKEPYTNHCKDTKHQKYLNSTDLAKHIWQLKKENIPYNIKRTMFSKI